MAKRVYTEKDIQKWIESGKAIADLPKGTILTPSARDLIKGDATPTGRAKATATHSVPADPILPDYTYRWESRKDPSTPREIQEFFNSPEIEVLKERMCDIGRRMWARGYTDGNGGNLLIRVGENLFLTTQTLICKGFMSPETISLVDFDGKQLAGKFKRTSECMTHLAIYRNQPKARATCHAHPPHATAYAVANVRPPTCMIPEAEVFLGQIGLAEYQTPGSPANAEVVGQAAKEHHSILMVNHGVITWGDHIEDAYWKMENTDSYCQTIWIASQLGNGLKTITQPQARELIELRKVLGMSDKREEWKECELCDNSEFRPGVVCTNVAPSGAACDAGGSQSGEADVLVKQITDMIMAELAKGN
ncbi:MAG TPA: class II aldolase/adducin family protein [Oceanipulchritudo sp.]|nr:class II aldolase/adducin family protein [Oceanipulchritudo sp.]